MIMMRHSVNNNTRMGLVVSLCSNSNHLISLIPPSCLKFWTFTQLWHYNQTESWRKIKNFLKPKGQCDYPALSLDVKTAKTNADNTQLFAKSVERHFGIQNDNIDSKHFDEVNQFTEDNYGYFYPPEDPDDYRMDMDDDHDLVAYLTLIHS